MTMDRNGMSHRPAGQPGAGRFEGAMGAASDDDLSPHGTAPGEAAAGAMRTT